MKNKIFERMLAFFKIAVSRRKAHHEDSKRKMAQNLQQNIAEFCKFFETHLNIYYDSYNDGVGVSAKALHEFGSSNIRIIFSSRRFQSLSGCERFFGDTKCFFFQKRYKIKNQEDLEKLKRNMTSLSKLIDGAF